MAGQRDRALAGHRKRRGRRHRDPVRCQHRLPRELLLVCDRDGWRQSRWQPLQRRALPLNLSRRRRAAA